jgi:NCS1 family nucleobase:cation symporter-1
VAWYGIQTYLASAALDVVLIKLFPSLAQHASLESYGFLGLPLLGWCSFGLLWVLQAIVFWRGMESIRRFIDFCGPAVYVVMFLLCGYLIEKAGFGAIDLKLGKVTESGWGAVGVMPSAIALVVSYSTFAIVLGALTFAIATIGINIVANFISPAFDFSNVNPQRISWRAGGMIAAVGSVLITPWNLYQNPDIIHLTLETLGAFIGPLFGVLIADYYLVRKQRVVVDDLFTMRESGRYWYRKGYNPAAVYATIAAAAVAVFTVVFNGSIEGLSIPGMDTASKYSWFIGCAIAFALYHQLATKSSLAVRNVPAETAPVS